MRTIRWTANYPTEQLDFDYNGEIRMSTQDAVELSEGSPDAPLPAGAIHVLRSIDKRDVDIDIQFYWPPAPGGATAGYTAPLQKWDQTTITGLTTDPIDLRGYYSQTYRPEHHNFSEHFLFEPALEPGVPVAALTELQNENIRYLYVYTGGGPSDKVIAIGFDGGEAGIAVGGYKGRDISPRCP